MYIQRSVGGARDWIQFKLFSFPLHKNTIVIIRSVNYEGAARDAAAVLRSPTKSAVLLLGATGDERFPPNGERQTIRWILLKLLSTSYRAAIY